MTVDLMNPGKNNVLVSKIDENAVQEAAVAGLQSLQNLVGVLSADSHRSAAASTADYAHAAVTKFKKFISLLDRTSTGHARFRRGPLSNPPVSAPAKEITFPPAPILQARPTPLPLAKTASFGRKDVPTTTISFAAAAAAAAPSPANSFRSSLTGDSDSGFQITNLSQASSGGRPDLSSSSFKRKCNNSMDDSHTRCTSSSGRCHCSKKRKSKSMKRVVRVPAISLRLADIPPDDYSWRKYGQKPIKGSPHPRGYYKCSSLRGCPARKKVERALDDPTMLIVTYDSEHNHTQNVKDSSATVILESS